MLRAGASDRALTHLVGHNRRTIAKYRAWAQQQGLLEGPLPSAGELQQLLARTLPRTRPPQQTPTLAPYQDEIAAMRAQGVEMAAIRVRLDERHGHPVSYSAVRRLVQRLEPRQPQAVVRVEAPPGSEARVDFGYAGLTLDPASGQARKSWVFVLVLSWSRHLYAEVVFDQRVETWLRCHQHAFEAWGGVPARLVPDNLKAAIVRASFTEPLGEGVTAAGIGRILADYGATSVALPAETIATARVYEQAPEGWQRPVARDLRAATLADATQISPVEVGLWTSEEGRSGLSITVTVRPDLDPPLQIQSLHGFPPKLIPALQDVVHYLVVGDYAGLVADGRAGAFTAPLLESAIAEYRDTVVANARTLPPRGYDIPTHIPPEGYHLIDMPPEAFKAAYAYPGRDGEWTVDVDLWWSDGEPRQLTLQAYVRETAGRILVAIEDIHVLRAASSMAVVTPRQSFYSVQ